MVDYDPQDAVKEAHDLRRLLLSERDHTLRLRILLDEAQDLMREDMGEIHPDLAHREKIKTRAELLRRIREELPKR